MKQKEAWLSPGFNVRGCESELMSLRQLADQCEQWQVHRNDDRPDRDAQETNQQRLNQRQQVGNRRVYFLLVEISDLSKHRIERTGLFTNANHLRDHMRKYFGCLQRIDKAF